MNKTAKNLALVLSLYSIAANAQQTMTYAQPNKTANDAVERYEDRTFGASHILMSRYLSKNNNFPNIQAPAAQSLRSVGQLYLAKSAVKLNLSESENQILNFIRNAEPDPIAAQARAEMGAFYYDKGDYKKAVEFFELMADGGQMSNEDLVDMKFKTGYAYFASKKYSLAKPYFKEVKSVEKSPNYAQANYYYGLISFFERSYEEALTHFKIAEKSPQYAKVVPYTITQIMFAQKKYDDVIKYAAPLTSDTKLKNLTEIQQLVGQSYFEKGEYKTALPYLEKYVSNTSKVTEKDFYQVGFTQYKTGAYEQATKNFEQLHTQKNELGQNALYHLGDCYLKANNLPYARNAFKECSTLSFNPVLQQTAQFNYAKLSYQLGDDQQTLNTLRQIPENSPYHAEANDLMADVLDKMSDYQSAIDFIKKLPTPTAKQRGALQRANYNRAVQLLEKGADVEATHYFADAEKESLNLKVKAMARYWLGEIGMRSKQYDAALNDFNNFTTIAKTLDGLPEQASLPTAYYNMGYVYLVNKNYASAVKYLTRCIDGIKGGAYDDPKVKGELYPAAMLMTADCYTKQKSFEKANDLYGQIIRGNYKQADYAMLQQSKIYSTKEDYVDEISLLDQLISRYPKSDYADVALYRKGEALVLKGAGQSEIVGNYNTLLTKYPKSELYNATLLKMGAFYANLEQKDKALEYYKRVLTNHPSQREALDARNAIEGVYMANGDESGYIGYLNTLPEGNSRDIKEDTLMYRAAYTLFNKGDYDNSIVKCTNYMIKFPKGFNYWDAMTLRADAYFNQGKKKEAAKDYDALIQHGADRNFARNLERAGDLFYQEKNYVKSYNIYTKLADVSEDANVKRNAKLGQLRSAYNNKQYDDVIPEAKAALASKTLEKSETAEFNFYLAKSSLQKKDLNTAGIAFDQVVKNCDDERAAEARYQLAHIAYEQRKLVEAEQLCLNYSGEIPAEHQDWAIKMLLLLADIYTEKNELLNAKVTLQTIGENFPQGNAELLKDAKDKLESVTKLEQDGSRIIEGGDTTPAETTPTDTPDTKNETTPDPPKTTTTTPKTTTPKTTTPKTTTPPKPKTPVKGKGKRK